MGKKRLRLKTERIDGEEVVRMECVSCHGTEDADADIVFECWEMDGGPFPVSECPFCGRGTRIPKQGHRGDRGGRGKGKAPGQTEKQKIVDISLV